MENNIGKWDNKLKWWQVALISVAVSALGSLSGLMSQKKQRKLYTDKLKEAPWAPPPAVFAPAWTINNFFIIRALLKILANDEMPQRRKLLYLQVGIWVIFFSFNYVYFKKRSPILATIWTMSDNVLAIASLIISYKADKKTALNYVPLALWTTFASTLADYQALKNADPVFKTPALLD